MQTKTKLWWKKKKIKEKVLSKEIKKKVKKLEICLQDPYWKKYKTPIPFSRCLQKRKIDEKYKKFLNIFKQLHINIHFADVIAQIPGYAKFLKELVTNKKRLEKVDSVKITKECSALIQ